MTDANSEAVLKNGQHQLPEPRRSDGIPAPDPLDLKKAMDQMPDGPNIEASPWELEAARGETTREGPHADDDPVADEKGVHCADRAQ
jgi:hypothetical protein